MLLVAPGLIAKVRREAWLNDNGYGYMVAIDDEAPGSLVVALAWPTTQDTTSHPTSLPT